MGKKVWGFLIFGVLLFGTVSVAQKTDFSVAGRKALIEVHGPKIAFVPMTEKYVTYDGKVRRIVKFTGTVEGGKADCRCPHCCDGDCYVVIYTDLMLPGGPVRTLFILWIEC